MAQMRERRCIVTGQVKPESELIRFVTDPDNHVLADLDLKLPGRGAWVTADRESLDKAVSKNLFSRAFQSAVQVAPDLVDRIIQMLDRKCLDQLGLARRAGRSVLGYDAVRLALKGKTRPGLRLEARDGAEDGRNKIDRLSEAIFPGLDVLECYSAEQLGQTMGRDRVVHGLILPGPEADRIGVLQARLARLKRDQD